MGGTLNVSLLYKIHLWIFSSLSMIVYVFISTIIITFYFLKVCKFEKMNAILAALPISAALLELKNNNLTKEFWFLRLQSNFYCVYATCDFYLSNG